MTILDLKLLIDDNYDPYPIKKYFITEDTLANLNLYNKYALIASVTFSLATAAILTTVFVQWSDLSSIGQAIMIFVPPTFAVLSIMFGLLSFYVYKTKKIIIDHIKDDCEIHTTFIKNKSI